jgi:hypothetical protein
MYWDLLESIYKIILSNISKIEILWFPICALAIIKKMLDIMLDSIFTHYKETNSSLVNKSESIEKK